MYLKNILAGFLALATAVLLSIGIIIPAVAAQQLQSELRANCADPKFSKNVEKNTYLEVESGIVYVSEDSNNDTVTMLPYESREEFSACSSESRELIKHVKDVYERHVSETCTDFKAIIAGEKPLPERDGKKANIEGAVNFVKEYCKSGKKN